MWGIYYIAQEKCSLAVKSRGSRGSRGIYPWRYIFLSGGIAMHSTITSQMLKYARSNRLGQQDLFKEARDLLHFQITRIGEHRRVSIVFLLSNVSNVHICGVHVILHKRCVCCGEESRHKVVEAVEGLYIPEREHCIAVHCITQSHPRCHNMRRLTDLVSTHTSIKRTR